MTLTERMQKAEAERHMPTNVVPMRQPRLHRATPRWLEWTRENQKAGSKELTGYIGGGEAA